MSWSCGWCRRLRGRDALAVFCQKASVLVDKVDSLALPAAFVIGAAVGALVAWLLQRGKA